MREAYFRGRVARCGEQPRFAYNMTVLHEEKLSIGNHVEMAWDTLLDATGGITLEDWSGVGPGTALITSNWKSLDPDNPQRKQGLEAKPIVIGRDVWLGANCIVNMGVTIGQGAIVSAGSVVNKDIPPFALVSGNPGRVIGWRKPVDPVPTPAIASSDSAKPA